MCGNLCIKSIEIMLRGKTFLDYKKCNNKIVIEQYKNIVNNSIIVLLCTDSKKMKMKKIFGIKCNQCRKIKNSESLHIQICPITQK